MGFSSSGFTVFRIQGLGLFFDLAAGSLSSIHATSVVLLRLFEFREFAFPILECNAWPISVAAGEHP